jgi:hypothetical protein
MDKHKIGLWVCLVVSFWSASSYAVVVNIDSFSVSGTNSTGLFNFIDNFGDGPPPPCGPAGCASQPTFYAVNSQDPLPNESSGLLQLDSSNGLNSTNAGGGARRTENVTVSGAKSQLLQTDATGGTPAISMTGVFTLPELFGPLNEGYGIRFIDAAPGSGFGSNQWVLELNVQWWTGNLGNPAGWYVRYLTQDFVNGVIDTIGADLVSIPQGADEILLSLNRLAGSNQFEATYAYVTGGTAGASTSLGSAQGFTYQDPASAFVRPQFHAFESISIPEPAILSLFGLGLAGLGAVRRKKLAA